jgi:hypothetical protein
MMLNTMVATAALMMIAGAVHGQTSATLAGAGPGVGMATSTVKMTATIVAIDPASRTVVLKGPHGNEMALALGPEVKNFAQMKAGDRVDAQYVEAVTVELKKGGGLVVARLDQAGAMAAKPGTLPAGAIGREVTVVAEVIAVDPKTQMVTLKGPQRTVDLRIANPDQFKRVAKGDQVEASYIEAVAIAVESATATKQ